MTTVISVRGRDRAELVAEIRRRLAEVGVRPRCLATTASGEPGHPLYLSSDLTPGPLEGP